MKNIKLTRPIAFFDLETTGVDVAKDRIVEISVVRVFPDGRRTVRTKRVNPTIPISPEATAVHGITDEDVANEPFFQTMAAGLAKHLEGCDLAGYNIMRFDLPLLVEEMLRAGVTGFPEKDVRFVDAMSVFHHFEKRDLKAALQFYCDEELVNAHSAEADTLATAAILSAQVERYDLGDDLVQLQEISTQGKEIIDFAGKFTRNENGEVVFNFGQHAGKLVVEHGDYIDWMLGKDFTFDTKEKAKGIMMGEIG